MRNVNIFRTHVTDHIIPSEIMRRAIVLSPGKDWTDQKTEAYKYLKRWALEQDKRYPPQPEVAHKFEGVDVPGEIMGQAEALGDINDKRTKAYKFLKNWIDNNENS